MAIYNKLIAIWMEPAHDVSVREYWDLLYKLIPLRERYHEAPMAVQRTQDERVFEILRRRVDEPAFPTCVASEDCAFELLYKLFGVDYIAYLFGAEWVPFKTFADFSAKSFLKRLAVLERALNELEHGTHLPLRLPDLLGKEFGNGDSSELQAQEKLQIN